MGLDVTKDILRSHKIRQGTSAGEQWKPPLTQRLLMSRFPPIDRGSTFSPEVDFVDFRLYPQGAKTSRSEKPKPKPSEVDPKVQNALLYIQGARDRGEDPSDEGFEVAHGLFNYAIKNYRSKQQLLSTIKDGFERAFLELERQLALADEHASRLGTMKPILSRQIRQEEFKNNQIINKLHQMQMEGKSTSVETRAEEVQDAERARAAEIAKITDDIRRVQKALEEHDMVYKLKRVGTGRVETIKAVEGVENQQALLVAEIRMISEDLRFNQAHQKELDEHESTQRAELKRLNGELAPMEELDASLDSQVKKLMRHRAIITIVRWSTKRSCRKLGAELSLRALSATFLECWFRGAQEHRWNRRAGVGSVTQSSGAGLAARLTTHSEKAVVNPKQTTGFSEIS